VNEARQMRLIALVMFLAAVVCALIFVATGFTLGWMLGAAALLIGSFMAVAVSFAA
jgi:hypothetical protein